MQRDFENIQEKEFDLVIIGGGIIGGCVARDAAMRGLKTLILDKEDFGYGTTSASTRLIHGGFRYLQHFEFGLVRDDMREREILLRIAPHLVKPLQFLIPLMKPADRFVMSMGTLLYDILSYDKSLPGRKYFSRKATSNMEPNLKLEGLRGAYRYYDCQIWFTERLCLENVISAAENGAVTLNHTEAVGIIRDGDTVKGVKVRDVLTGREYEIKSRMVLNAAGPWMDSVAAMMYGHPKQMVRRTKGIHLLTPRLSNNALVLFAKNDGRLWFVIPWEKYSLVGTTDTDYNGNPDDVCADKEDLDYLMAEVKHAFPHFQAEDVYYTQAGLRALPDSGEGRPSNVSRAHQLFDHEKTDGIKGIISVLGGKITGSRGIAEEITDDICEKLGVKVPCTTASVKLPGAGALAQSEGNRAAKEYGIDVETTSFLISVYGSRFLKILELTAKDQQGKQSICSHSKDITAQIWHAVNEENALTVSDFILRRSSLGLMQCQGLDGVETVAREMGNLLKWSDEEKQRQIESYRKTAAMGQRCKL